MKRVLAFFLSFVMLLSSTVVTAFAANDGSDCIISVKDTSAMPGSTVLVDITVENNPGIQGATMTISWGESLTLKKKAQNGAAFAALGLTAPTRLSSPYNLVWYAQDLEPEDIKSGVIATLEFEVTSQAKDGDKLAIDISYVYGDILDNNKQPLRPQTNGGVVSVSTYTPGNVNSDERINALDLIDLSQYIADGCTTDPESYNVSINPNAGDVDNSGRLNALDLILISQYIADGCTTDSESYNVKLVPSTHDFGHKHTMRAIPYVAPTCETAGNNAYWYCTTCQKYFSNENGTTEITRESMVLPATGHIPVVDAAVPATYESKGLTEGSHCSVCQKVLVAQEEYGPLTQNQYSIEYFVYGNDEYLAKLSINNPNPQSFTTEKGVEWLEELVVPGYNFEGWFDGQGSAANRVTSIPAGTARNIRLYAKWTKEPYTITFDNSSMSKASTTKTYTVDQKITLDKPTIDRYVFLGWTTDSDELVSEITPGTTGNFTLHSNWTSKRNLAKPVSKLGDPLIIEDTNEGKILFAYEIGQIENVPLYTIKDLPSAGGVVSVYTETTKNAISTTDAATIAEAVDHVTTDSTAWTLSEDWNTTTHVEDSVLKEHGYDRKTGQEIGKTSSNTYTLTTNEYDNTIVKANDGTVATTTQYDTKEVDTRETWESKASLSVSDTESVKYTDSAQVSAEIGVGYGPVSAKVGASMESSTEISSSTNAGASTEATIAHENTSHSKTGTDKVTVADKTKTTTSDKGWNKAETSSSASSSSFTEFEEKTLSASIAKTFTYGQSYALGGANSKSADWSRSTGESTQYSSTVTYFNSKETTERIEYEINGEADGSYRLVRAGIVHVFAVVIYDIANAEYTVATYDVLDDKTYTYIDYSATSAAKFNDNENGVLPFEIPYFVNDYVNGRIVCSEGLEINNLTGETGEYKGDYTSVVIPEYISVDNKDNTRSAVTVRGLSEGTFKGKTNIKSVLLSNYIREIPASAFAGCSSLQFVLGSEINSIGAYAFDGCTSLESFKVSSSVTSIGENAFRGVDSIEVTASSPDVVLGAIQSGAKHITINISAINKELENVTLEIPNTVETFELQGGRKDYSGLKINSNAGTTILNGLNIKNSISVPLTISSENITLNQVTVDAPNYVLLLKSMAPTIELYGTSVLKSDAENAVVCRNVTLEKDPSNVTTQLAVTGNVLCYGEPVNVQLLKFVGRGELIPLTGDEYDKYIKGSVNITLNANGGEVVPESITAYLGSTIGPLPTPTRDYYTFDGWYTDANGGSKVVDTDVFTGGLDVTLYAHWSPIYVTSLQISTPASKTNYYEGDTFSANGLSLLATYNDGTTKTVSGSECTISSPTMTGAGTKNISVTYDGVSTSYNITVTALTISISCDTSTANSGYVTFSATVPCGSVTWSSSNNNVASINSSGRATFGNSMSNTTITAVVNNNGYTKSATKTISLSNTGGTKYKETSSSSTSTVTYGEHPSGYSTSIPVISGSIPSYYTNDSDITGAATSTATGKIVTSYSNSGVAGYVYYQYNYSGPAQNTNDAKIINYQEGYRHNFDASPGNYYYYYANLGCQFYSTTDYSEYPGQSNWTQYCAKWWAYQDKQAGHPWYSAAGISGAKAMFWYRFPLYNYKKTTTTYTYYYYTVS